MVHSFDGSAEEAQSCMDLGYFIGINGWLELKIFSCGFLRLQMLRVSLQLPENRGEPGCGQDDSSGAAPAGDGLPLVRRQAQSRREQIHQDEAGGEVSWRIHFLCLGLIGSLIDNS